jgi:hypothetical protein
MTARLTTTLRRPNSTTLFGSCDIKTLPLGGSVLSCRRTERDKVTERGITYFVSTYVSTLMPGRNGYRL